LFKVLGASFGEQVITISIAPARCRQWFQITSKALSTESVIITYDVFVDVLAWVAVPQGILTILLPPFTFQVCQGCLWIDFREWAGSIAQRFESKAFIRHGASHKVLGGWRWVGEWALGGTVLILQLHFTGIVSEESIATILTFCELCKHWVSDSFCHCPGAVDTNTHLVNVSWRCITPIPELSDDCCRLIVLETSEDTLNCCEAEC
jgi:hypothetical protein